MLIHMYRVHLRGFPLLSFALVPQNNNCKPTARTWKKAQTQMGAGRKTSRQLPAHAFHRYFLCVPRFFAFPFDTSIYQGRGFVLPLGRLNLALESGR